MFVCGYLSVSVSNTCLRSELGQSVDTSAQGSPHRFPSVASSLRQPLPCATSLRFRFPINNKRGNAQAHTPTWSSVPSSRPLAGQFTLCCLAPLLRKSEQSFPPRAQCSHPRSFPGGRPTLTHTHDIPSIECRKQVHLLARSSPPHLLITPQNPTMCASEQKSVFGRGATDLHVSRVQ